MMSEGNNRLYHSNDGGFDRLEEKGEGVQTRHSVLRSVPMPRPWSTRGAIALLLACGVLFGVIAITTLSGSESESNTANTETAGNNEGASIVTGSGSMGPSTVKTDMSWKNDSTLKTSANDSALDTSANSSLLPDESADESDDDYSASSLKDTFISDIWIGSASVDSVDESSVSGSDSTSGFVDTWFTDSTSDSQDFSRSDSASGTDWQSSFSMSDDA